MRKTLLLFLTQMACIALSAKVYLVAVGVGMNDFVSVFGEGYENRYMANEAHAIAEVYRQQTDAECWVLVDSLALRDSIVNVMRDVYSKADTNDIVVFFFSGHGYPGGFAVHNGQLSYLDVRDAMAQSRSNHKVMFVQACYAGGMETKDAARTQSHYKDFEIMVFMSSHADQPSYTYSNHRYSIFTEYLIEALEGQADKNGDGVVTAGEVFLYVKGNVTEGTLGKQKPRMWGNFPVQMPIIKLQNNQQ